MIRVLSTLCLLILGLIPMMMCGAEPEDEQTVDPVYRLPPPPASHTQNDPLKQSYDHYDRGQRALDGVDDPHRLAVPASRSVSVSFSPGQTTNIIRIAQDYPASVTFLDETGQPWPIRWNVETNKGGSCDAQGSGNNTSIRAVGINACVPESGSNVIQITPISRYARGGMLVSLEKSPKPIAFMIVAGTGSYDADLTVRVLSRGPNAKNDTAISRVSMATNDSELQNLLDGIPPESAVPLMVEGASPDHVRAWHYKNYLYLRTEYTPILPGPVAQQSEYEVTAYKLPESSRVILSDKNQIFPISLREERP